MFPYLIPTAVLSQITGTRIVRLRKMYEPILTVYVDDLEKLLKLKFTSDVSNGFLSRSNHQRFARWLVQLATAQQTVKVEEKPLTKRRDQTAVL